MLSINLLFLNCLLICITLSRRHPGCAELNSVLRCCCCFNQSQPPQWLCFSPLGSSKYCSSSSPSHNSWTVSRALVDFEFRSHFLESEAQYWLSGYETIQFPPHSQVWEWSSYAWIHLGNGHGTLVLIFLPLGSSRHYAQVGLCLSWGCLFSLILLRLIHLVPARQQCAPLTTLWNLARSPSFLFNLDLNR